MWFQVWYHGLVVRRGKLLQLARHGSGSLKFKNLCALVEAAGFQLDRQVGSHLIYRHPLRREVPRLNLQEGRSGAAKPYQVKQVLRVIDEFLLEVIE